MFTKKISKNTPFLEKNFYQLTKIKDLSSEERPREKILKKGVDYLKPNELLALILGVGTKKEEVLTMSSRLLREYGDKEIIYQKNPQKLAKDLNIPIIKACQIVACFELGRRFYQSKSTQLITIRNSRQAFFYLKNMGNLKKEQLRGLYLNNHYQLIHDEIISLGTLTSALIEPREVFQPALEYSAVAIIIAHNHPSNILEATKADIEITKKIKAAGEILNIELLDHLIIGQNNFLSII